ncbi:hypothetical protein NDK25_16880 [Niallia taxi]|uniref:hypothetical protein n=1 Tax=Niallia taxi TaxID=2499688 RepID=UPI0023AA0302|nr:hypothetical protein [Niallia taxi]MDE5053909.1 hypothetical protein [Niallia taxi]
MSLNDCKPLLLNELFLVYIQQKYPKNASTVYGVNYFLSETEINKNYFEEFFEEVHITRQEDNSHLLELFTLTKNVIDEFDYCYNNGLLNEVYSAILDTLQVQEILVNHKGFSFPSVRIKELQQEIPQKVLCNSFLNQLTVKYAIYNRPSPLLLFTPYIKWTKDLEMKISAYFGSVFKEIHLHLDTVDNEEYIIIIELSNLRKADNFHHTSLSDLL